VQIDSHQHFWRPSRGDYGWLTSDLIPLYRDFGPADLTPILQRHEIAGTVLVQAAPTVAETEYLLAIAAYAPFVKGVVGWAGFDQAGGPADIERLAADPRLKGMRPMIQDIADPEWMLRPELAQSIAALGRCGLAFDALLRPEHLGPFKRFLKLYPDLPVVLDHGAKPAIATAGLDAGPFDRWSRDIREIARDLRLHCKLSGLATEAAAGWRPADLEPYLDLLLESFGPSRLMWGSDWPVVELAGGYDLWRKTALAYLARLSEDEREAILGGTAAAFYRL
jgi:L-fuconolactonase